MTMISVTTAGGKWLFITVFKCHLLCGDQEETGIGFYELISSHEGGPQSKDETGRILASPAELSESL